MLTYFKSKKKSKSIPIKSIIFLKIKAGNATSGPPIGATLGQYGIPAAPFCKLFNERTSELDSEWLLEVTIFLSITGDYSFVVSIPTLSFFILKACNFSKGSPSSGFKKSFLKSNKILINKYMIYEIVCLRQKYIFKKNKNCYSRVAILRNIKKCVGSLSSMGISIIL